MIVALLAGVALLSFVLTGVALKLASSRGWLDIPNARSSHEAPTPRGGGIAIVVAATSGLIIAASAGWVDGSVALAVASGGLLIAVVGLLDDRVSLPAVIRIGFHFLAAIWALYTMGGLASERIAGVPVPAAILDLIAVLVIVWSTNLYNFMDGIDGIAAVEALSVGTFAALFLALRGSDELVLIAALLAVSNLGFIAWNWAPARIFMGDIGSGFLGFAFGCLAIAGEKRSPGALLWIMVLAGVFVFDATLTLIRRALHREPVHAAHRSHAYQRITRAGFSHSRASTAVLVINIVLGILVLAAAHFPRAAPIIAGGCLLMLVASYVSVERRLPMYPGGVDIPE